MDSQGIIILFVIALVFFCCMCSNEGYQSHIYSLVRSNIHNPSSSGRDMQYSTFDDQATPMVKGKVRRVEDRVFPLRGDLMTGKPLGPMEDMPGEMSMTGVNYMKHQQSHPGVDSLLFKR